MPGMAVVFWLGERLLLICPVASPDTPTLPKRQVLPFFPPDFARSLKFDWRLVR